MKVTNRCTFTVNRVCMDVFRTNWASCSLYIISLYMHVFSPQAAPITIDPAFFVTRPNDTVNFTCTWIDDSDETFRPHDLHIMASTTAQPSINLPLVITGDCYDMNRSCVFIITLLAQFNDSVISCYDADQNVYAQLYVAGKCCSCICRTFVCIYTCDGVKETFRLCA